MAADIVQLLIRCCDSFQPSPPSFKWACEGCANNMRSFAPLQVSSWTSRRCSHRRRCSCRRRSNGRTGCHRTFCLVSKRLVCLLQYFLCVVRTRGDSADWL